MITQCSHCNTKFEISAELVASDDPRVRCGECLNVFNAKVQLVVESPFGEPSIPTVTQKLATESASMAETSPAVDLADYISPEELENAATVLLDDANEKGTSPNDGFYSPDMQLDFSSGNRATPASTVRDSEFAQTLALDTNKNDFSFDANDPAREPVIDTQAAIDTVDEPSLIVDAQQTRQLESEKRRHGDDSAQGMREHIRNRGGNLSVESETSEQPQHKSMLLPLVCVGLALAAVLYFARDRIAALDLPEPALATFCSVTGCELPVKKDLSRLELLQHRTNIHAEREDVLVINVDLVNNAPFPQPYPVLAVRMASSIGETIAERRFEPADYLEQEMLAGTLPAGEPVRIRFEILDPGPDAVTSELAFE